MNNSLLSGLAALSAGAALMMFTPAEADDLSGHVAGTQKMTRAMPLSGDRVARRMRFKLTVITDDPASPFNLASQDCMATYVFAGDGAPLGGHGYCDGISAAGDIWWISVELGPDGMVRWTNIDGTGALGDFEASGTTKILAEFDDGKMIGRFEGTMSKK